MKKAILTRPLRGASTTISHTGMKPGEDKTPLPPPPLKRGGGEGGIPVGSPQLGLVEVLEAVKHLEPVELKQLYDHLGLALATGNQDEGDLSLWSTAVYDALVTAIGSGGAGMAGPLAVKRVVGARSCWSYVRDFAARLSTNELQKAERLSVYRLLAKLLVSRCAEIAKHARVPLTPKLTANNCEHLAAIFEDAFPGYLGAGLVPILVRRLLAGAEV